jgi:GTP cyclohydrolase II
VHRAASDLRRGVPVVLTGESPLVILAAETASLEEFVELKAFFGANPMLILAPTRAAAILRESISTDAAAVALMLPASVKNVDELRYFADPLATAPAISGVLSAVPAPGLSDAAIGLAKIGRLLPAILAVPLSPETAGLAACQNLGEVAAADVLAYPDAEVGSLRRIVSADVPLINAPDARVVAFRSQASATEHLAILIGRPEASDSPLVRIHSECFTGDLLGSMRCDCGDQLRGAIAEIAKAGGGAVLYLSQEGRGIGLANKLRAYELQDAGFDTVDANELLGFDADERVYLPAAAMLKKLGFDKVRLLTNNPEKVAQLGRCGITVVERVPHAFPANAHNERYLRTKAVRSGHLL